MLLAVLLVENDLVKKLQYAQLTDPEIMANIEQLNAGKINGFIISNELLFYKDAKW